VTVRIDAADSGSRQEDILRSLLVEEVANRRLIAKIEFVARAKNQIAETTAFQGSANGTPDEAAVSGNEDPRFFTHAVQ
jgi:hypothetical protein